jgi:hypothetical protein
VGIETAVKEHPTKQKNSPRFLRTAKKERGIAVSDDTECTEDCKISIVMSGSAADALIEWMLVSPPGIVKDRDLLLPVVLKINDLRRRTSRKRLEQLDF